MTRHSVFVYGTLKRGEFLHHRLQEFGATFRGLAITESKWPMVIASTLNNPYVLDDEGHGRHLLGEIYEVDDATLELLDRVERHPVFFVRTPIKVIPAAEVSIDAGNPEKIDGVVEDYLRRVRETPESFSALDVWMYVFSNFRRELLQRPFLWNYESRVYGDVVPTRDPTVVWKEEIVRRS